nr:uncharacterized protein LOC120365333 [Saimiri boliviensis boliviensis]
MIIMRALQKSRELNAVSTEPQELGYKSRNYKPVHESQGNDENTMRKSEERKEKRSKEGDLELPNLRFDQEEEKNPAEHADRWKGSLPSFPCTRRGAIPEISEVFEGERGITFVNCCETWKNKDWEESNRNFESH